MNEDFDPQEWQADAENLSFSARIAKYGYCRLPDCYCEGVQHP